MKWTRLAMKLKYLAREFWHYAVFCPPMPTTIHGMFLNGEIQLKVFATFDSVFHICLTRGLQKYAWNLILMMAFWDTCFLDSTANPAHMAAVCCLVLVCPQKAIVIIKIFAIPSSSSRHKKLCQMLQRIFALFQHSRNIPWIPGLDTVKQWILWQQCY